MPFCIYLSNNGLMQNVDKSDLHFFFHGPVILPWTFTSVAHVSQTRVVILLGYTPLLLYMYAKYHQITCISKSLGVMEHSLKVKWLNSVLGDNQSRTKKELSFTDTTPSWPTLYIFKLSSKISINSVTDCEVLNDQTF